MSDVEAKAFPVCDDDTQWYRCGANDFAGCCAVDPCNLAAGCPDPRAPISTIWRYVTETTFVTVRPTTMSSSSSVISSRSPAVSSASDEDSSSSASASGPDSPSLSDSSSVSSSDTTTMASKTDSGITHTIPNDSTVTVTRHTTITRGVSSSPTDSAAAFTTEAAGTPTSETSSTIIPEPTETLAAESAAGDANSSGVNGGAVAGIAVGAVFVAALIVVLAYLWRTRRSRKARELENANEGTYLDKSGLHDNILSQRPDSAMLPHHPEPSQTSRGYGYDPFAPFGGRIDQQDTTSPPPANTFEMDGRGIQVAELPGTSIATPDDGSRHRIQRQDTRYVGAVKQRPSSDPHATLNHLPRENGRPVYINQWNQYRTHSGELAARKE